MADTIHQFAEDARSPFSHGGQGSGVIQLEIDLGADFFNTTAASVDLYKFLRPSVIRSLSITSDLGNVLEGGMGLEFNSGDAFSYVPGAINAFGGNTSTVLNAGDVVSIAVTSAGTAPTNAGKFYIKLNISEV